MDNKNRRGLVLVGTIIFIVLNLVIFTLLIVYVYRAGTGAAVYEQAYAKQIVLVVDEAKPGTTILIDMGAGIEIAEKNGIEKESIVRIVEDRNEIIVKLADNGGYSYKYFNDYDVRLSFNKLVLNINIEEKGGENA